MAIIVEDKNDFKRYILLGAGHGMFKGETVDLLIKTIEDKGEILSLAVCDNLGNVRFMYQEDVRVVEVDGQPVADIDLKPQGKSYNESTQSYEYCPACKSKISIQDAICPDCGIALK